MMKQVICPHCNAIYQLPEYTTEGQYCRNCGKALTISKPAQPVPPVRTAPASPPAEPRGRPVTRPTPSSSRADNWTFEVVEVESEEIPKKPTARKFSSTPESERKRRDPDLAGLTPREKSFLKELPLLRLPFDTPTDFRQRLGRPLASLWLRGSGDMDVLCAILLFIGVPLLFSISFFDRGFPVRLLVGTLSIGWAVRLFRNNPHAKAGRLWACRYGILWERNGRLGCCQWSDIYSYHEEVQNLYNHLPFVRWFHLGEVNADGIRYVGTLQTIDEVFHIRGVTQREASQFGQLIQQRLVYTKSGNCRRTVERGQGVEISPFYLTLDDIEYDGQRASWKDVEEVTIEQNRFRIHLEGYPHWLDIPYADISESLVFFNLVEDILHHHNRLHVMSLDSDNPYGL
ncbi:MAG: hypothetical protein ACFCD0_11210 [Gemmataceae bacterium]